MRRRPGVWLAVAESITCGRLQARIGAISGASAFFRGGVTAYTLEGKVRLLGVDRAHAAKVGCVSRRVAGQASQLEAQGRMLGALYENLPLATLVLDMGREGRPVVVSLNPEAGRLLGVDPAQVRDRPLASLSSAQ